MINAIIVLTLATNFIITNIEIIFTCPQHFYNKNKILVIQHRFFSTGEFLSNAKVSLQNDKKVE